MKKPKKVKKSKLMQLDQVSVVLEALTGLTLTDIIRQACAQSEEDAARLELENILKMDEYLKQEKERGTLIDSRNYRV